MRHILLRAVSLYFVAMFLIMVPAAAWNTPGADYSRSDCCFSSDCWDGKPGPDCMFTAKVDSSWDWQLKEWRGYNNPDAHVYLLQNGIRILQEKGYDNWAAYLADENNFQALADGATWADHYKGRWWVHVYATALLGVIEIPVYEFDPTCAAGWDHYYNSYQTNAVGKGLESVDASVITQYFLDAFGPIISSGVITGVLAGLQFLPVVGFVFQGLLALQTIGMVGIKIEISPAIRESYPSAGLLAEEHFDSAVDAYTATHDMTPRYWEHRSAQYDSLFQVGWATHFAQDVCVIYHQRDVWDTLEYYHAEFEDQATGLGDPDANSDYHVHANEWKVAANYDSLSVPEICREGATAVNTPYYWEKAKSEDPDVRDVALQQGLKVADQVTAAMLAKYLTYLGIPKTVPPFNGTVRDSLTGKSVEGAYVFYREKLAFSGDPDAPGGVKGFIDQQRPWDYTITDVSGDFSLNLQEGRTYLIRAELPGYTYSGYIDVSTQEPITQKVAAKTVEFTQGYAGEVTSAISYWLYLSPTDTGPIQMVSLAPAPVFYSYAGPDPSLPLAAAVSPALRRDLADAVMTVRTDTTILSAQAPGAPYPLQVPGQTYFEVEVANLLNVGTATTLQSPQAIETTLASAKTSWALYDRIVRNPAEFQAFNPAISQPVPVTVPIAEVAPKEEIQIESVRWQYSVSPEFAASRETLTLDPLAAGAGAPVDSGYSPAAIGKLIEAAPKEQVVLPDGNVTWVPLLSYAFGSGNMIHGEGQPLRENHLGRVPAANAKIRVTLLEEPGAIGPEFTIIPATMGTVQYVGADKPAGLVDKQMMQPAFATPTPKPATTQSADTTAESLTTLTNSEGVAAFTLRSGSQSGKIRLMVEVIENPGASGIKPHEVIEVMVQPPLLQVGAPSATVPPSIGVVSPRQPLVATYLASYNPKDVTIIDTGMALQITEAEEGTLVMRMVETGPVVMASTPVPVKVVTPEKPPSGILSGIIEAILSIPKQIIGIFTGGEEEAARPADGTPCNDGNACTTNDRYEGGVCVGGPPLDCDDGNPRTEDYCDPERGCRHEEIGGPIREGPCNDGNACTTNDMYEGGVCIGGPPLDCDDGNPETEDWCDPERGCRHETIGEVVREGSCDDGNACTTNDLYEGGVCIGGPPLDCDDGNPRTEDWCDPAVGCRHEPVGEGIREGPCDDGNACTTNDMYEGGVCIGGPPLDCDDGNARTEDWCDPAVGCRHEPIGTAVPDGTPCDDGNACTTGDYYRGGVCVGGVAIDWDDDNPATDDWCDPAVGCQHSSALATCPRGCECLTEAEADYKFMNFVQCLDEPCGYTAPVRGYSEPKYCYRSAG